MAEPLLDIRGLKTWFKTDDGMVRAVDGVSLHIDRGETLGVVGESGCGKTGDRPLGAEADRHAARPLRGRPDPVAGPRPDPAAADEMDKIRAREIAIIFQEPMTSLNPVYTVGYQIAEVLRQHQKLSRKQAIEGAVEMLRLVNIPNPASGCTTTRTSSPAACASA
jgi:peptide/nickel transport system ATP-binding protein